MSVILTANVRLLEIGTGKEYGYYLIRSDLLSDRMTVATYQTYDGYDLGWYVAICPNITLQETQVIAYAELIAALDRARSRKEVPNLEIEVSL